MQFHMPARLIFGPGQIQNINTVAVEVLKAQKPVLITDKGVAATGLVEKVTALCACVKVYDEIEANPKSDTINTIGRELGEMTPDLIIGLGGGSAMDAGKALALLATNPGKIEDYEGREKYRTDPLPFLAVPTTCGTGSEVTWVSVITDVARKFKMSIKGPKLYPAAAIVDPDLIKTLPKSVIASTGLDALTHAVEAYLSKPATLITDMHAQKAVQLILASIESAWQDIQTHATARENLMYGSTVAGFAFGNSDVTAVHCISESIGALYDVPHGIANSVFLPHVLSYNMPSCLEKMAGLARTTGIDASEDADAALQFIRTIKELSARLDIPEFRELGIGPEEFERIADMSFQNNSNPSNPRPLTRKDYTAILEMAFSDD